MKLTYALLLILLVPFILFSENTAIDSLKNQLTKVKDEEMVDVYNEIANVLLYQSPQQSLESAEQAYNLSQSINYSKGKILALKLLGAGYHRLSMYDKALEFYHELIENLEIIDDKKEIANTLNRIGIVYEESAKYKDALNNYLAALEIYEEINYKKGIALSLNNIGLVYWNIGTYESALEYYLKALTIFEELGNKQHIAHVLNNLGIVYKSLNDQNKALEYYLRSLHTKEKLGDTRGVATSLGNIAIIYKDLNKYDEAMQYYERVLEINKQSDDKWETANTLNNIGNLYLQQGDYDQAQRYLEQGLKLAKEIEAKSNISNSYFFLSELYSSKGDYKKSLDYYKRYSEINDTIFAEESTNKILELQTKYETEKKERENQLLKINLEITQLEKDRLTYILIGAFVLIAFILFYSISRTKINRRLNHANKDLKIAIENANQVREQIALINKILRHDLTNSFAVIQSALELYQMNGEKEMLDEIKNRCQTSVDLIKKMRMLEIGSMNSGDLKLMDVRDILIKLRRDSNEPIISISGDSNVLADEALESIFINLVDNARLHGNAKHISFDIEELNEFTTITVTNNGNAIDAKLEDTLFDEGITSGQDGHSGMGLFLVRQNINRYGGSILLSENKDHHVTFIINLQKINK